LIDTRSREGVLRLMPTGSKSNELMALKWSRINLM